MSIQKIQVFILSQQPLFRQGIEYSLAFFQDITILGATEFTDEVLSIMDDSPPDVAVVDIDCPFDGGLEIIRQLKQSLPNIGLIGITSNYNDAKIFQALKYQAAACLNKETTVEVLVDIIRRVARGEHPINDSLVTHPILADQVLTQFEELSRQNEAKPFISPLTPREMEILEYITDGLLNKQIAGKLGISEQTIKNHVTSILRKLNANARTEAVIVALKRGLVSIK